MPISVGDFARAVSVDNLMVHTRNLVRASHLKDAIPSFADFDIVPAPARGRVSGYFEKSSRRHQLLSAETIISSDTPLIELPGLLSSRPFYFVNSGNNIVGYIHYSDLNKAPIRAPFFALLEAAEVSVSIRIRDRIATEDIKAMSTPGRYRALKGRLERRSTQNLDLGWLAVLKFGEILRLARRYRALNLDDEDLGLLVEFRNRIAHTNLRLIENYNEIRKLSKVEALLRRITKSA